MNSTSVATASRVSAAACRVRGSASTTTARNAAPSGGVHTPARVAPTSIVPAERPCAATTSAEALRPAANSRTRRPRRSASRPSSGAPKALARAYADTTIPAALNPSKRACAVSSSASGSVVCASRAVSAPAVASRTRRSASTAAYRFSPRRADPSIVTWVQVVLATRTAPDAPGAGRASGSRRRRRRPRAWPVRLLPPRPAAARPTSARFGCAP